MIKRLASVIHWVGFICSLLIGFYIFVLFTNQGMDVFDVIDRLFKLLAFDGFRGGDRDLSIPLWVAVSHWPIKFIITGNKNLFPWSS